MRGGEFPRSHERGPIEAVCPPSWLREWDSFPRSHERGPIEARGWRDAGDRRQGRFPRSHERGPIEADGIQVLARSVADFRARTSAAPLKLL